MNSKAAKRSSVPNRPAPCKIHRMLTACSKVIICCIPTYAPLFRAVSQKVSSGHSGNYTRRKTDSQYVHRQPHTSNTFHHDNTTGTGKDMRNGRGTFSNKTATTSTNAHELKPIHEREGTTRHPHGYVARSWASNIHSGRCEEVEREGSEEHIIKHDENRDDWKITATTEVTVERDKY